MTNCLILKKLSPLGDPALIAQKSKSRPIIKKSKAFQNGMTQPGSTNYHRGERLQGKDLDSWPSPTWWGLDNRTAHT